MTGRQSAAVDRAMRYFGEGENITVAAKLAGVDVRSLRRALRRAGVPPLPADGRPVITVEAHVDKPSPPRRRP